MDNDSMNRTVELPKSSIDFYKETVDVNVLLSTKQRLLDLKNRSANEQKLLDVINERIEQINNINLQKQLEDAKEVNPNLKNIEILNISENMNNKDNYGFRNDANYLKVYIGGKAFVYEIPNENIAKIEMILGNTEALKDLSEEGIREKLSPYINSMEEQNLSQSNSNNIKEEANSYYDNETRKAFTRDMDKILIEKATLEQYMKINNLNNVDLIRTINSKGERLYILGDKTIKFLGDKNDMYFLTGKGNELVKGNINEKKEDIVNSKEGSSETVEVEYFIDKEDELNKITDKIYAGFNLDMDEEKEFEMFIKSYVEALEKQQDIYAPLVEIYDTFYASEVYVNDEIERVISEQKEKERGEIENKKELEGTVKKYVLDNTNGFVNMIYIIVSIILTISILFYLFLVNR